MPSWMSTVSCSARSMRAKGTAQSFEIEVVGRPGRVAIDPYYKLIDRNPGDNSRDVEEIDGQARP